MEEESDSEDEAQQEAVKRVEALDPEVKAKYVYIVTCGFCWLLMSD